MKCLFFLVITTKLYNCAAFSVVINPVKLRNVLAHAFDIFHVSCGATDE